MEREQPAANEGAVIHKESLSRRVLVAILLPVWVVIGFVLSALLVVGAIYLLLWLGLLPAQALGSALFDTITAALVYSLSVLIVVGVPIMIRQSRTSLRELGLDRLPNWQDFLVAPAGFVVYAILTNVLVWVANMYLPGFDPGEAQDVGFRDISYYHEYVLAFLTLVIIAPVAEEVLIRGYLYGKLRGIVSVAASMLVTALLFAILHLTWTNEAGDFEIGQWNVAIDVFALSLAMTSLREVSGSLWPAILLHMMKNGLAFYVLFINPSFLTTIGM